MVTESTGFKLIGDFLQEGIVVNIYDSLSETLDITYEIYGNEIFYHKNFIDCIKSSNFCIVVNMNKEYMSIQDYLNEDHIVFDFWRAFNTLDVKEHIKIGVKQH